MRVLNRFFRMWDFLYLKLGIHDFKAKSERDSGLKVYRWDIKNTCSHWDYGLCKNLSWDDRIEDPCWGASSMADLCTKCFAEVHLIILVLPFKIIKKIDDK